MAPPRSAWTGARRWRSPIKQVFIGRIGRPHGLAGELYVDRISLSAAELAELHTVTWRGPAGASQALTVREARAAHDRMLVQFEGLRSREQAQPLTNGELWVDDERLPDPGPGTAYAFQLVGLRVVALDGRAIGVVRDVVEIAGASMYLLEGPREVLIPGHEPFVKRVDLAAGAITVDLPPGLEDLNS